MGGSPFCTVVHSFPQTKFQIPLAKESARGYSLAQIEPGSLKNLTAQLKEGAAAARQLRPQSFLALFFGRCPNPCAQPGASRGSSNRSAFWGRYLTRKRSKGILRSKERRLASARRDPLDRRNLAIPNQQRAIKVVHRGTNVARKQVKEVSDLWP